MERYVLIRPGALGDALLAFPALALLRRARPAAHCTLVARRDVLALAEASGLAQTTIPYDLPIWEALFTAAADGDGEARQIVADSTVVAWMMHAEGQVAHSLERLGARRLVVQRSRAPAGSGEHTALCLSRALISLGLLRSLTLHELVDALPDLHATASDVAAADVAWRRLDLPTDQAIVALHAGSGGAAKRWPPTAFGAVAGALRERGVVSLLVEGPQDGELTAAVQAAPAGGALPVVRGLSVGALAELLRRCAAYLGNDSGVTQLAALVGIPVVALFGPSDPALWRPLGGRVEVLRPTTCAVEDITDVAAVELVLKLLLPAQQ